VDTRALQSIIDEGADIHGTWKLHVSDHAPIDVGKLNSWRLEFER
jgi:subtilisin-like proprotein convertase family protein